MPSGGTVTIRASNVYYGSGAPRLRRRHACHRRHAALSQGLYIRIEVSDTGLGISNANLEKIFDRSSRPTFRNSLALPRLFDSAEAQRLHHGEIRCRQRATFSCICRQPLKLPRQNLLQRNRLPQPAGKSCHGRRRDYSIHPRKASAGNGYTVVSVGDGAKALEAYRQAREKNEPFLAVLMDLTIPRAWAARKPSRTSRVRSEGESSCDQRVSQRSAYRQFQPLRVPGSDDKAVQAG